MWQRIIRWWNRPSAKDRILAALSSDYWLYGSTIADKARILSRPSLYFHLHALEEAGKVESRAVGTQGRRLYRLVPKEI